MYIIYRKNNDHSYTDPSGVVRDYATARTILNNRATRDPGVTFTLFRAVEECCAVVMAPYITKIEQD